VLNALALLLVAYLIPDIHVTGLDVALVAAVVIVINGFLFWGVVGIICKDLKCERCLQAS